jgi:multiple sugar transport system ATP-binding protein
MASIRLNQLTKVFPGVRAVDGLQLEVPHGSFTALLGPSGCGKTTTMNMISGLEDPTSGEILFGEHVVTHLPPGHRNVGFVFQNYALFTHMSVYDNLAFGLRVGAREKRLQKDELDREVRRVAEVVGLTASLERKARRLSVNDMQKVALGRSMIVKPAIFLLDEPFSNLDAAFRAYMRAELKHIQAELGQTMVYVTHDQVEAMSMADRIAVMDRGVLQQYGSPDDLYNRPENRFVARFVGSVLINMLPATADFAGAGSVTVAGEGARAIPLGARAQAVRDGLGDGAGIEIAFRPETVRLVPPDSSEATLRAKVTLVEPLGSKDVTHMTVEAGDVRVVHAPARRPRIGDVVGVALDPDQVHVFDDASGLALR